MLGRLIDRDPATPNTTGRSFPSDSAGFGQLVVFVMYLQVSISLSLVQAKIAGLRLIS